MAQPAASTFRDMFIGATSMYPAAIRTGVSYWSEMVVNASVYYADIVEAMISVARNPRRSEEVATQTMERLRDYLQRSGDTIERAILDFNQAIVTVARPPAEPPHAS